MGGSIRIPAFCWGVFGHKRSGGLVPGTGNYPPAGGRTARLFTNGVLARRAEDLLPLLRLIAGPDGVDPLVVDEPALDAMPELRGLTVVVSQDAWPVPTSAELRYARERAAGALAAAGARVEHRPMPRLRRAWDLYITTLARTSEQTARQVLGGGPGCRWACRWPPVPAATLSRSPWPESWNGYSADGYRPATPRFPEILPCGVPRPTDRSRIGVK